MSDCIFCRIVRGEIPSKVYEDEHVYAFHDINPVAPVHVVVPKVHVDSMAHLAEEHEAAMGRLDGRCGQDCARAGLRATVSAPSVTPEESACRRCIICTFTFWAGRIPCRPC